MLKTTVIPEASHRHNILYIHIPFKITVQINIGGTASAFKISMHLTKGNKRQIYANQVWRTKQKGKQLEDNRKKPLSTTKIT